MNGKRSKKHIIGEILIALVIVLIFAPIRLFVEFELWHNPRDKLSNYTNTQWKCEKLGLELFVSEDGVITGIYMTNDEPVLLDVSDHTYRAISTNYLECLNRADSRQCILLYCIYRNVDNGVFYATVDSYESTMDIDAIEDGIAYKFIQTTADTVS